MLVPLLVSALLAFNNESLLKKDHGPGTSGGGLATQSGEVMKPGAFSASLRIDYTQFERFSDEDIRDITPKVGGDHKHFDAARWSLLETIELSYGASEDIQIGYSFGYYKANDVREGHIHASGTFGFHNFGDVSGMTDHWVTAKARVAKGASGSFAVFAGIKLPFGDENEVDEGGNGNATLEPALQPGSGTFDGMLGVAYSIFLSETMTLDTSAGYTRRTREDDFKIGDLVLFGIAVARRFTENVQVYPQPSVFLELNVRHLTRNREGAHEVRNSGGSVLFISPGFRYGFSERVSFTISPQIPVVQALKDEQQETDFKVSTGFTFSF